MNNFNQRKRVNSNLENVQISGHNNQLELCAMIENAVIQGHNNKIY